jgi:hypothetical protein
VRIARRAAAAAGCAGGYFELLLPRMCLNRHYADADGVRKYSQSRAPALPAAP